MRMAVEAGDMIQGGGVQVHGWREGAGRESGWVWEHENLWGENERSLQRVFGSCTDWVSSVVKLLGFLVELVIGNLSHSHCVAGMHLSFTGLWVGETKAGHLCSAWKPSEAGR